MKHVNKNDDLMLLFKLRDASMTVLNPAEYSFSLIIYTRKYSPIEFDIKKGEPLPSGITFDNHIIKVCLDSPNFAPGEILCEIMIYIPDISFPDGFKTISSGIIHTNIHVHDTSTTKQQLCSVSHVDVTFYDYIQEAYRAALAASHAAKKALSTASSANDAAKSANDAAISANDAATSATTAATSANDAAVSATTAAQSASDATNAANAAATSATTAATNASSAAASATAAATSANDAATSANDAATSATTAATNASSAAALATAAAQTASDAATSANAAATNAGDAAALATIAAQAASDAATSANNAAAVANAAAASATTAASNASSAAASATAAAQAANDAAASVAQYADRLLEAEREIRELKRKVAFLQSYQVVIGFYRVRSASSPDIQYLFDENEDRLYNYFKIGLVNDKGIVSHEFAPCSLSKSIDGENLSIDGSMGDVMQFTKGEIYAIQGRDIGELKVWLYSNSPFVYEGIEAHKFARHARGLHFPVVDGNKLRHVYNKTVRGSYGVEYGLTDTYCDGYGFPTRAITQFNGMLYNRNKNADTGRNFPFMLPMTWMHEIRAGMIYHEAKTMNLSDPALFGSGMTVSQTATLIQFDDVACTALGGVKITLNGKSIVAGFSTTLFQVDGVDRYMIVMIGYTGSMGLECMEGQRALAYAYENKIEEGVHFTMPSSPVNVDYKYRSVPNCKGLKDGVMTGVVFKYVKMTTLSDNSVTIKADNVALDLLAGDPVNGAELVYQMPIPIYRGENIYGERFVHHVGLGLICHNEDPLNNPLIDEFGENYYEILQTLDWEKVPVYTNTTLATYRTDVSLFDEEQNYEHIGYMSRGEGWAKETFDGCSLITKERGATRITYECLYTWLSGTTTEGRKENKASAVGCYWNLSAASVRTVRGTSSVTIGYDYFVGSSAVPDLDLAEEEEAASRP